MTSLIHSEITSVTDFLNFDIIDYYSMKFLLRSPLIRNAFVRCKDNVFIFVENRQVELKKELLRRNLCATCVSRKAIMTERDILQC